VLGNSVLKALLVAGVVFVLGEAAINALAVFFLQSNLHSSPKFFGLLASAEGVGGVLGAVMAGAITLRVEVGRLLWMAALAYGAMVLILSRASTLVEGVVLLALIGAMFATMEVCDTPLLLRATPASHVGRVASILLPAYSVSDTVAALGAGWLASTAFRGLQCRGGRHDLRTFQHDLCYRWSARNSSRVLRNAEPVSVGRRPRAGRRSFCCSEPVMRRWCFRSRSGNSRCSKK
jgi:MFS family permease